MRFNKRGQTSDTTGFISRSAVILIAAVIMILAILGIWYFAVHKAGYFPSDFTWHAQVCSNLYETEMIDPSGIKGEYCLFRSEEGSVDYSNCNDPRILVLIKETPGFQQLDCSSVAAVDPAKDSAPGVCQQLCKTGAVVQAKIGRGDIRFNGDIYSCQCSSATVCDSPCIFKSSLSDTAVTSVTGAAKGAPCTQATKDLCQSKTCIVVGTATAGTCS